MGAGYVLRARLGCVARGLRAPRRNIVVTGRATKERERVVHVHDKEGLVDINVGSSLSSFAIANPARHALSAAADR